eukprot:TRINITY_DN2741_c0_g2_i1.p1 TRINITY_DN2741_c0_g2~~TRINITY_DN2741_c0_g2_i1.p1  ORF type:complete len:245 (-),score=57.99 TRINITY_DN2741_c0_g2_i1:93-827(-)
MAAGDAAPMELEVDLGPMPEDDNRGFLLKGLRSLLDNKELCDVALMATGGEAYPAHRAVLAASSHVLRERLPKPWDSSCEQAQDLPVLRLDVKHPEAVKALLDCVYGVENEEGVSSHCYNPSSEAANHDVLRLARDYRLPALEDQAARWLARGLTTANVLQRLKACEEFGLTEVRNKILEQLIANTDALYEIASNPAVTETPKMLQDLLLRVLQVLGCGPAAAFRRGGVTGAGTRDQPAREAGA